tara:strand:+ start:682016 stop:682375 length:360 start_codon:yes stop_codon:yes gene_type:complete
MNMKSTLRRAMQDSDFWVIEMDYVDAQGNLSHRVVSPIRFVGSDRFLALCLCREAPRQFQLSRCQDVRLVPAAEVLMPMPIATTPAHTPSEMPANAVATSSEPFVAGMETTMVGQACMA